MSFNLNYSMAWKWKVADSEMSKMEQKISHQNRSLWYDLPLILTWKAIRYLFTTSYEISRDYDPPWDCSENLVGTSPMSHWSTFDSVKWQTTRNYLLESSDITFNPHQMCVREHEIQAELSTWKIYSVEIISCSWTNALSERPEH